jgi:hypothetical protein
VTQHAGLTEEHWAGFDLDRQVLMIANEMQRAAALMAPADDAARRRAYERALRLLDLTVATRPRRALRRELLRWRDLVAALYIAPAADPEGHRAAFRCLLLFTPAAARQIPHMAG